MKLFCMVAAVFLMGWLPSGAQTVRLAGSVWSGETYRHPIGRGLVLEVSTDGIAVRPASSPTEANYAACETPPAHGPNPLDLEAWHFDPARSEAAPGLRREFRFALTAKGDKMECALATALFDPHEVPGYRAQRLGKGVLTLSEVKLAASGEEIASLRFTAVVTLPRPHTR